MDAGALEALVSQQIVIAMKAHDAVRTRTLRLIKNALKNKAIEKREPLTPAEEQQALATMIKQRRDSIDQFTKGNRPELAAKEAAEIVGDRGVSAQSSGRCRARGAGRRSRRRSCRRHRPKAYAQGDGPGNEGRPGQTAGARPTRRGPHRQRVGEEGVGGLEQCIEGPSPRAKVVALGHHSGL